MVLSFTVKPLLKFTRVTRMNMDWCQVAANSVPARRQPRCVVVRISVGLLLHLLVYPLTDSRNKQADESTSLVLQDYGTYTHTGCTIKT